MSSVYDFMQMDQLCSEILQFGKSVVVLKKQINANKADDNAKDKVLQWEGELQFAEEQIEVAKTAAKRRNAESGDRSIISSDRDAPTAVINQMTSYIKDKVMEFDPNITPVHTFVSQLRIAYSLFIENNTKYGRSLEDDFIRAALSRLNSTTLEQLTSKGRLSNLEKFENLSKILEEEYCHLSTSFQLLQSFFELDIEKDGNIDSIASRLDSL